MLYDKSLKTRQICLFFIAFMPVIKFFMMPSVAAGVADRDEWICCLFNLLADFFTLFILIESSKNSDDDFFGLCEKNVGKPCARIFYVFFALYFLFKAYVPISEQRDYVELTLYSALPTALDFMPFILLTFYLSQKKLRVIGRISDVIWFFVLTAYLFLFALSLPNADFSALRPVGKTRAASVVKGCSVSLNWYGDAAYFVFFIGRYKHKKGDSLKILGSYAIAALVVLAYIMIFYGTFSSIAFRQRFALTEMAKYSTVINNVGRFDYFAIFFLLFASVFSVSFPLYFACRLLERTFSPKKPWILRVTVFALYTAALIFFKEYNAGIENFMQYKGAAIFLFFGNVVPLVVAAFAFKEKKNFEKY